jgi:hypothetical protein
VRWMKEGTASVRITTQCQTLCRNPDNANCVVTRHDESLPKAGEYSANFVGQRARTLLPQILLQRRSA